MKNNLFILTGLLALTAVPAHAQFNDGFEGKKLGPLWTFTVPGSKPADTAAAALYTVKGGTLNLTLQPGSMQAGSARNVPTVTIAPGGAGDYTIETKVIASFDKADGYPFAGLIVLTDPKNFVYYGVRHNNFVGAASHFKSPNYNFPAVSSVLAGKMDAHKNPVDLASNYTNVSAGVMPQAVTLTIKKAGQTIAFGYISATGKAGTAVTLRASDTGDKKAAYNFLSTLGGKQVGLYTDTNYTKTREVVSFGYFQLSGLKAAKQ